MPLNLQRTRTFLSRLHIRDRDEGDLIPFTLNIHQEKVLQQLEAHQAKRRRLFAIFLKARRVGLSTLTCGLQTAHALSKPIARGITVAQNKEVAKEQFQTNSDFAKEIPLPKGTVKETQTSIRYYFDNKIFSSIRAATAATVHGARGLTFSCLHMTEAAFYPYEGAYTALLNTVSKDPDNVVVVESTANGIEGPGQAFYEAWQAAEEGESEFLPIFLPWYDDPEYIADPELAKGAPRDSYEKWLMEKFHLGKERIAFYRRTLRDKCEGSLDRWKAEYPSEPEEAFVASGTPAFTAEEQIRAQECISPPIARGFLTRGANNEIRFYESHDTEKGKLLLWEYPQPGAHYFGGVDTARGNKQNTGDFAAHAGWNAETGKSAWRFAGRVETEMLAYNCDLVGRFFNNAMLNVEINNLGYVVMKDLRDKYHYPNQYRWRGRDDKADAKATNAYGFDTNYQRRQMMFNLYRTSLSAGECFPLDGEFVRQMCITQMEMGWRWEVAHGHDDIMLAYMLAWIALVQNHIPHQGRANSAMLDTESGKGAGETPQGALPKYQSDPFSTELGILVSRANEHLRKLEAHTSSSKRARRIDELEMSI